MVGLFAAFFAWADQELPRCTDAVLSVVTGQLEQRPREANGRASRAPLVVQVPYGAPGDNAARCLHARVWYESILPEIARVRQLAHKSLKWRGRRGALKLREVFAQAGSKRELSAMEASAALQLDAGIDVEGGNSDDEMFGQRMAAEDDHELEAFEEEDPATSKRNSQLNSLGLRHRKKRRRDAVLASATPPAKVRQRKGSTSSQLQPPAAGSDAAGNDAIKQACVERWQGFAKPGQACVERWESLRGLLSSGIENSRSAALHCIAL